MEAFASYLMKSAIWLTRFAIVYFLFLRNERYFMLKDIPGFGNPLLNYLSSDLVSLSG